VSADNPPLDEKTKKAEGQAASPLERELLPSLTAYVTFHVAERKDALLVPNAALRWRPQPAQVAPDFRDEYERSLRRRAIGEPGTAPHDRSHGVVWVEDKGFVRPVRVTVGLTDGARTELLKVRDEDQLDEGAPVVVGDGRDGDDAKNQPRPKYGK
jgi:HlyD family secretion protein